MSRTTVIGNGNLLVGIDRRAQVRDFYYPFVGHSNHVSGASGSYTHRLGIWADGVLRWTCHSSWSVEVKPDPDGTANVFVAKNLELGVSLVITDVVHNEHDVFLRNIQVVNDRDERRTMKLFFGQEFRISESRRGDTAMYDPRVHSVIHYKGHATFLIHAKLDGKPFDDYSVGLFGIENREGTYADAEDGMLSKNAIEHGSTDSVIGISHEFDPHGKADVHYWIAAGSSISNVHELHHLVESETPERLIASTENYWRAWMKKEERDLSLLDERLRFLYHRSLMVIRMHADNRGGIIASSDSDVLNQGRDTYSYVWPRDAAFAANALDRAGYPDTSKRLFEFLGKLLERDGYLMHKYLVNGSLGSSWHPWLRNGSPELPIQEDETATAIFMLARHYEMVRDLEFIERLYNPFIEPAADFMCGYIEHDTGLPAGSYDLWEEKFGTSTYTAAAVYGALVSAADISALLGKRENAQKYRNRAESIKHAMLAYLYDAELGAFIKLVRHENGTLVRDKTLDMSSLFGITYYGVFDVNDARVVSTRKRAEERLKVQASVGGYMRFEGDNYYRSDREKSPNPWCVTTLWMAQHIIRAAKTRKDLAPAYEMLKWVFDRATESGILPEQIDPNTGAHLSTSPLVWSHAEYVVTVHEYMKRHAALT